jgi:hypothetical protein
MRPADENDTSAIRGALDNLQQYASYYPWALDVDFDKACQVVADCVAEGKAYIIDGYLVLIDKIVPWYSNTPVLQEWLVVKVYGEGSVSSIPPALLQIAEQLGCAGVMTADSSPVNIMASAYRKAGFEPLTQSFFKKVT